MSLCYLVRIVYKSLEAIVYKNISATDYPKFLAMYPDNAFSMGYNAFSMGLNALSMGLKVSKINVEKQFEED